MQCDDLIKLHGAVGFGNGLVGNFQGVLLIWSTAEQNPIVLAEGAVGVNLNPQPHLLQAHQSSGYSFL